MVNAPQQAQRGRFGWSRWQYVLLAMIVVQALSGDRGLVAAYKTGLYRTELAHKVTALRAENDRQRQEIQSLLHDCNYLESIARKELGMVREDEIVYQFARDEVPRK
ncbi:MAG: septum formation initiator family protein [Desulfuromonadaceae bacterium]|nr:septum formation initiator family protein [Desulfuromonadaceae bacterium]